VAHPGVERVPDDLAEVERRMDVDDAQRELVRAGA
jgi:hypothetical protein